MKEPEVSLRAAIYYIENGITGQDVTVCLDGAHIRTGNTVHFEVQTFLHGLGWRKDDEHPQDWQGSYASGSGRPKLIVCSRPGLGDVTVHRRDGKTLRIESKKGVEGNKSGSEYPLMREAIGQLMTGCELTDDVIPAVAVPYTQRSITLASKWSEYSQIKAIGLRFLLVRSDGGIIEV